MIPEDLVYFPPLNTVFQTDNDDAPWHTKCQYSGHGCYMPLSFNERHMTIVISKEKLVCISVENIGRIAICIVPLYFKLKFTPSLCTVISHYDYIYVYQIMPHNWPWHRKSITKHNILSRVNNPNRNDERMNFNFIMCNADALSVAY